VPFIRRILSLALLLTLPAFAASEITGVVTNKTTNKPAAGDDVVLIRLQQGMQESTRTKTDSRGRFTLAVPDEGIHLVRVTHDKANYFRPAPPGTQAVEVDVYNANAHVKGVTGEADVLRIQTDPGDKILRVVENFFVKNESTPPLTQFSDRPFEFVLPEGAVVDGSAALSPGGMPVQAAPVPLPEKGHYTFLFPIRPGETRFQVTYHIPYSGSFKFSPQPSMTTDTIAIMMPKSMTFKADTDAYSPVTDEPTAQTYVARNVAPAQPLGFTLSGAGQLPRDTQNPDQGAQSASTSAPADANASAAVDANGNPDTTKFGGGLGKPIDPDAEHDPWSKYKYWILGILALLLAGAAGIMLRAPTVPAAAAAPATPLPAATPATGIQQALKEEFFALETDRLQKKISDEEYATHKASLDAVLLRSLSRGKADPQ
jgi:5-hydroxyisourate hydrolase-like protein (transthyretin family)